MRVLMTTRKLDTRDDVVGFTVPWVRALAARVDHLAVICQEYYPVALPANVTIYSMGKEHGRGRPGQLAAFYRAAWRAVPGCDAIFCHMIQRYAWLIAPLARLHRVPVTLWYAHSHAGAELRLALALVDRVVTSVPHAFPLKTAKLHIIGQGIDTNLFYPAAPPAEPTPPRVVTVSRLSPVKYQLTTVQAAARLRDRYGQDNVNFVMVGGETAEHPDYLGRVTDQVARLGLAERFCFVPGVPYDAVPDHYRQSTLAVDLCPSGFDKAVLEAMLCGKPVIVANSAFDSLLGPHTDALNIRNPEDAGALADRLATLLEAGPTRRAEIGTDLHRAAHRAHSLPGLMDRLVEVLRP